ncbi:multidrug effflux MFS transporter [Massilia sp. TS11]|uniref:multidrug effflux MFS transporter n=1 Tax=Massilia sp. TS11 TaxID=2908003 RepID=UPI001ED9D8CE|nr:multidrug effflux MFS transporter [Massilia sp. TS11]MCG2586368.1 multidrug effflux MFS transporter [Massilia sp. TS11]
MLPGPPSGLPPDPETPVPLPPPHRIVMLSTAGLAALLAGLAMLGPFSIDTYLPAFPNIQAGLAATPLEVQQTLTAYMLAFAVMVLWHGALADAFGRRNVILWSLAVFAVGTLGCAASASVHYLWIFRILQGVSAGAGVVVGRAIIRDLYADAEAQRLMSSVTMVFSIAPAVAPILGGWIVTFFDWRAIFLFIFAFTGALAFVCYRHLPETLPPSRRQAFNPGFLFESYSAIFRSPLFHMKSGIVALNFAGLFLFITAAPEALPKLLHLGPHQFGWLFVPCVGGMFCGALVSNRFAGKISLARQIGLGYLLLLSAAILQVSYHALGGPAAAWVLVPMFIYTMGMSMVAPGATLLALDLFPHIRGTVASCQSFGTTLLGAVVAGLIAPALSHSLLALALGQLAFALGSLALWSGTRLYRKRP